MDPNAITFVCILKACGTIKSIEKGQAIHLEITQKGFERHNLVGKTLVSMYAKCGSMLEACYAFEKLLVWKAMSWTTLIAGYADHGLAQEALVSFEQMQPQGVSPNVVTFVTILKYVFEKMP